MNSVKSYNFPSIENALNLEQPGRVIVEILMTFTRVHFVELALLTHIPGPTIKIKPIKANWLTTFIHSNYWRHSALSPRTSYMKWSHPWFFIASSFCLGFGVSFTGYVWLHNPSRWPSPVREWNGAPTWAAWRCCVPPTSGRWMGFYGCEVLALAALVRHHLFRLVFTCWIRSGACWA